MIFSKLAATLAPSAILTISNQIKEKLSEGETIYNFTVGDFDPSIFPIPQQLEEAIIEAYRNHITNYPLAEGNLDLRRSIKKYIHEFQHLQYEENEILVASGGRPLIYSLFMALCDAGDRIVYPVPSWNNHYYSHFVEADQIVIETKSENNFMPTADEILPVIKDATLIALCSPQNPTGTVFSKTALKDICDLVVKENKRRGPDEKKLYIFFDQMYSQLVYGTTRHYNPIELNPAIRPYTITVDAISKSFAATGIRVGWCMGPAALISKMKIILTHIGAWAPMPEQKGVMKYFNEPGAIHDFLDHFKCKLNQRLQYLYARIKQLKSEGHPVDAIAPEAAIYLSLKIDLVDVVGKDGTVLLTAQAVTNFLLNKARLALIPFYAFGSNKNDAWYRLSVGTCKLDDMDLVIDSLRKALDNFKVDLEKATLPSYRPAFTLLDASLFLLGDR